MGWVTKHYKMRKPVEWTFDSSLLPVYHKTPLSHFPAALMLCLFTGPETRSPVTVNRVLWDHELRQFIPLISCSCQYGSQQQEMQLMQDKVTFMHQGVHIFEICLNMYYCCSYFVHFPHKGSEQNAVFIFLKIPILFSFSYFCTLA